MNADDLTGYCLNCTDRHDPRMTCCGTRSPTVSQCPFCEEMAYPLDGECYECGRDRDCERCSNGEIQDVVNLDTFEVERNVFECDGCGYELSVQPTTDD